MNRFTFGILGCACGVLIVSCGEELGDEDPKPEAPDAVEVAAEPDEEASAPDPLPAYTPLPVPEGFLPLTPRTQTEAEIDALIEEQLEFVAASGGYGEVIVRMSYGPELNLNPGPPGMRPTSEGGDLLIQGTVHLKDGTTIAAGPKAGSSQNWNAEEGKFLDSRYLKIEGEAKTRDIEKVTGEVTLILPVGILAIEMTRDGEPKAEIADGLTVTPNWDGHSVEIEYGEGCYRKIVHVVGIDDGGNELKIPSMGGQNRSDHAESGRTAFHFADATPLARIHVYAAPKFVERKVPFEVAPPAEK